MERPVTVDIVSGAERAAETLARAFTGDPLFRWVFPGQDHVAHLVRWWSFHAVNAVADPAAELWETPDGTTASLWYSPRSVEAAQRWSDTDRPAAYDRLLAELLGGRVDEVVSGFARIEAAHPVEPHWYLAAVGTRPPQQGRGRGAVLLQPVLDRCDRAGLGAYLESSNPRNLPFYHRLGFESLGELELARGAVRVTPMWRPPR